MFHETSDDLDSLIREEKHRVALEFFHEAWASAVQEGIETSILAESVLRTALMNLGAVEGENAVADIVSRLPERLESGDFVMNRSLQ